MTTEGGSASEKAQSLRRMASEARLKADRMDSMAVKWEAGVIGEQRVAAALAPLEGEHCRILHDRLLEPGRSRVNLDHVVLSVAGNYLIDAKNWSGEVAVHQGGLRQRTSGGSGRRLDDKVDKVRRMAERMESSTSCVVEPVLCLAGQRSAEFGEPAVVRGVFIVPVDRLAHWLLSRPRTTGAVDLRSQAVRFGASFPSATEPAFPSITPARGNPSGHRHRPARPRPQNLSAGASRKNRKRQSHRAAVTKLLVIMAITLSLMTSPGQRALQAAGAMAGALVAAEVDRAAPAPAKPWTPPCAAVTDAAVAKAVGHKVHRYLNGPHDSCTWGFVPRPNPAVPESIRVVTGWHAKHSGYPTAAAARYTQRRTSHVLTVPQSAAVPGSSLPPALITQPILVVISWQPSPVSSARARQAVAVLAGEVAKHMPTGAHASAITRR